MHSENPTPGANAPADVPRSNGAPRPGAAGMSRTPNTGVPTAGGAPSAIVGGAPSEAFPTLRTLTWSTRQSNVRTPGACAV